MNNYFGQLGIDKCLTFKGHIRFLSGPARTFSSRWHIRKERYLMHAKATVTKKGKKLCKPCYKIKPLVNCKRCARTRHKTRFRVNVGVILVIFQVRTDLKKRPKDINHGEHMYFACLLHWLRTFCQGCLSIKMRCGTLRAGCKDITLM